MLNKQPLVIKMVWWLQLINNTIGTHRALMWYANIRWLWLMISGWFLQHTNTVYRSCVMWWFGTNARVVCVNYYQLLNNQVVIKRELPQFKNKHCVRLSTISGLLDKYDIRPGSARSVSILEIEYWHKFKTYTYILPILVTPSTYCSNNNGGVGDDIELINIAGSDPIVFPPPINLFPGRDIISAIATRDDGTIIDIADQINKISGSGIDFRCLNATPTLNNDGNKINHNYMFNLQYLRNEKKIQSLELMIDDGDGDLYIKELSYQEHPIVKPNSSSDDVQDIS